MGQEQPAGKMCYGDGTVVLKGHFTRNFPEVHARFSKTSRAIFQNFTHDFPELHAQLISKHFTQRFQDFACTESLSLSKISRASEKIFHAKLSISKFTRSVKSSYFTRYKIAALKYEVRELFFAARELSLCSRGTARNFDVSLSYQPMTPEGPKIHGQYFVILFPFAQEGQRNFDVSLSYQPMTPDGPITPWSIFYIPEHTLRTINSPEGHGQRKYIFSVSSNQKRRSCLKMTVWSIGNNYKLRNLKWDKACKKEFKHLRFIEFFKTKDVL